MWQVELVHQHQRVAPGSAVRIMTGALVPVDTDAVVRFEETDEVATSLDGHGRRHGSIGVLHQTAFGENIRPAGEDVCAGTLALASGTRLRPAEVGLLAAIGLESAVVHRRPRVAILATGDEVVDAGCDLRPGQFWNSNSPLLAAMVRRFGGEPILLGVAQDSTDSLRVKLSEGRGADLLITTGGVSVGDYDLVKDVLRSEGRGEIWQVRIKPGKPLAFGWIADTPIVGLPGNPVAPAVACEQFCRPVILKMLGRRNLSPPTILARVQKRVENFGGRRHFVRVRIDASSEGYVAYPASAQGASMLSSLAFTNGLLIVPEEMVVVELGTSLPVQMLDWDID